MKHKVLVAVDDSENAMRGVEFIAENFTKDHQITLFNVIQNTAAICDMNSPSLTPYFLAQQGTFCNLEDRKKELVKEAFKKSKEILVKAGFEEKNISTKMEVQKKGVARDIIDLARSGYDTIVLGRRGLSAIQEFLLGSVSQKVLHGAQNVTVVVVE